MRFHFFEEHEDGLEPASIDIMEASLAENLSKHSGVDIESLTNSDIASAIAEELEIVMYDSQTHLVPMDFEPYFQYFRKWWFSIRPMHLRDSWFYPAY